MSVIFSFPLTALATGTLQIPSTAVPAGTKQLTFAMQRCTSAQPTIWPNQSTTIKIDVYGSNDNANWWHIGAATAEGGIFTDASGNEVPETTLSFIFAAHPAYVRATAQIADGPLNTSGTVTAS